MPETPAKQLSRAQLERIRDEMGAVVRKSVEANADADAFPEDWLFHRRWGKVAGSVNGSRVEFITVGGRTTAFVPAVQKKNAGAKREAKPVEAKPANARRRRAAPRARRKRRRKRPLALGPRKPRRRREPREGRGEEGCAREEDRA